MIGYTLNKTVIRIYGGDSEIGGNCIVIRSPSRTVMLDQGVNFSRLKKFYGFAIQPSSTEEMRNLGVLPPRDAYRGVDEVYISHLHLDHVGTLNIPVPEERVFLPSTDIADVLSKSWWFGWKKLLFPRTPDLSDFPSVEQSKNIKFCRVSHSAYPSYAFRVDTEDTSIIYTGDFRLHSIYNIQADTLQCFEKLSEGGVDALIIEGTNFGRRMSFLPLDEFMSSVKSLLNSYSREMVFISAHPLDIEATLALHETISECGFTIIYTSTYYAHLLDTAITQLGLKPKWELYLSPSSTEKIPLLNSFEIASVEELKDRRLAVFVPPYDINDIKRVLNILDISGDGLIHITVLSEPQDEEWIVEEKKLVNWFKLLGLTSLRMHVSGHYLPHEFEEILKATKPKKLIPIHTSVPKSMLTLFEKLSTSFKT